MVLSSSTFVKGDATMNETISYPRYPYHFLVCFTDVLVLLMLYSDVSNGDNNC